MNDERNMQDDSPSSFELDFRLLGNELIGLRITVDDFKTKWIILSMVIVGGLGAMVANYGPEIKALMAS